MSSIPRRQPEDILLLVSTHRCHDLAVSSRRRGRLLQRSMSQVSKRGGPRNPCWCRRLPDLGGAGERLGSHLTYAAQKGNRSEVSLSCKPDIVEGSHPCCIVASKHQRSLRWCEILSNRYCDVCAAGFSPRDRQLTSHLGASSIMCVWVRSASRLRIKC